MTVPMRRTNMESTFSLSCSMLAENASAVSGSERFMPGLLGRTGVDPSDLTSPQEFRKRCTTFTTPASLIQMVKPITCNIIVQRPSRVVLACQVGSQMLCLLVPLH